jgi:predicted NBD/HSP70 family sugar kinase
MKKSVPSYVRKRLDFGSLSSSRALLQLLEAEGLLSQPQAAERLGITTGACNLHFQRLEHEGLIERVNKVGAVRGRPTVMWAVSRTTNGCLTFVFDVPYMQATLFDFSGKVILEERKDFSRVGSPAALTRRLRAFMDRAADVARVSKVIIRQVLITVPGLLEAKTGVVLSAVNFPQLNGLDIRRLVPTGLGWACHTAPLGLAFYYGERLTDDPTRRIMLIHWDLGVGVLCGVGQKLISFGIPGEKPNLCWEEYGHTAIGRGDVPCQCGRTGCLEAHVGGWAMIRDLRDDTIRTLPHLVVSAQNRTPRMTRILRKAARLLGEEVALTVQLLDITDIMISGPVAPLMSPFRNDFLEGLSRIMKNRPDVIPGLSIQNEPEKTMQTGAFRLARRVFFYPLEY